MHYRHPSEANFLEHVLPEGGWITDNGGMRSRSLIAFLMGAVLFAVVPYFDSEIPGEGERGELIISVVRGLVVGATVVLLAGHWRAWSLALASALAGALAAQIYYEIALEPPPRGGFELESVAFGAFYAFLFSGPFVVVGALVAGAALSLASTLRRAWSLPTS
jgi:hypothetical protein